jgi:DNA-binding CsgD family transcriptional regulator
MEQQSPVSRGMSSKNHLLGLIDLVYQAVLDADLWPAVLIKLADTVSSSQIAMPSFDWRANVFATIAPRFDPEMVATYENYWAFREPLVPRAAQRPIGELYVLDNLMPREEFAATPVFNEFWRPTGCGLAAMGANLVSEDRFSSLICVWNAPGNDSLTTEQLRLFEVVLPHIMRAVRINRRLRDLEIAKVAPPERFDALPEAVLLTDASARVVRANAAGKRMLDTEDAISVRDGRLTVLGTSDALQKLVSSCAPNIFAGGGPGGEIKVPRDSSRSRLRVTVAPLRAKIPLKDLPWIGVGSPVAIVTVMDPDLARRQKEKNLRVHFDLTAAEAAFAGEILKGDGRKAAAQRCGISDGTAKTHLANIFEKTGTHRQAELIRLLLEAADGREPK